MFNYTTTIREEKKLLNTKGNSPNIIAAWEPKMLGASRTKSLLKAISYRILGSLATIVISFALTQEVNLSLSIGALDLIGKIGLYYLHERLWDRIS